MKSFSFLILLFILGGTCLQAQNGSPFAQTQQGAAVISSIYAQQVTDTRSEIEIRIAGNRAHLVTDATIAISGPSIPGGVTYTTLSAGRAIDTNNGPVVLKGSFAINVAAQSGPTFIDVQVVSASTYLEEPGDGRVFWHWSFPVTTTNP